MNCRSPLLKTYLFRRFINFSIVLNKKKEVESQLRCSVYYVKVFLLSGELIVRLDRSFQFPFILLI